MRVDPLCVWGWVKVDIESVGVVCVFGQCSREDEGKLAACAALQASRPPSGGRCFGRDAQ